MGAIRFFIIALLFPASSLQNQISQHPNNVTEYEGNSLTIQCSVDKETDIRELSLTVRVNEWEVMSVMVHKSISNINEVIFSGKIRNFSITANGYTWNILESAYCRYETCQGELSRNYERTTEVGTIFCMAKHKNFNKTVICKDNQPIISLTVNSSYTDRLRFSGTIQNFSMTLENLNINDRNGYYCGGTMEESRIDLKKGQTVLNVVSQRDNSHTVTVTWLLILSSLLLIWWC
ncbi:uncharacterized protein LOC100495751 [Xenopus tropicalis]|uniref:Uncharacterized protein LOC100495751 n=1 Tax=Xenopus tropicalis TaxID=8364 RepID=A0A8J1IYG9_XENTR|nr:uncharacterized protein LOC100495751 [Xenopus tropicalis]XP_031750629.1 uncharacterized protein LOC100495751 [Xenopus tropicalis]|eukprot:XP_002935964.1 PREDICTED: uncharacterized protein LOC100495751 isoform X2 [Xenopus tropicalis]